MTLCRRFCMREVFFLAWNKCFDVFPSSCPFQGCFGAVPLLFTGNQRAYSSSKRTLLKKELRFGCRSGCGKTVRRLLLKCCRKEDTEAPRRAVGRSASAFRSEVRAPWEKESVAMLWKSLLQVSADGCGSAGFAPENRCPEAPRKCCSASLPFPPRGCRIPGRFPLESAVKWACRR